MSPEFYLLLDQAETGPFSVEQVSAMIRNHEIAASTYCRTAAGADWKTVGLYFPWASAAVTTGSPTRPHRQVDLSKIGRGTDLFGGIVIAFGLIAVIYFFFFFTPELASGSGVANIDRLNLRLCGIVLGAAMEIVGVILLAVGRLEYIAALLDEQLRR